MLKKINLVPGVGETSFEISVFQKKLRNLALFLTGFFVVSSIIVFFIIYKFNSELEGLGQKINLAEGKIKSQIIKEGSLLVLKNRLGFSEKVIKNRTGLIGIIDYLRSSSPEGVRLEVIESTSKSSLRIGISALSLNVLDEFINNISSPEFKKKLIYLNMSSITRSENGAYSLVIELTKA